MQRIALFLLILLSLNSCKSAKQKVVTKKSKNTTTVINNENVTVNPSAINIIDYAKKFDGVKYKYGGTTKKGMDCSGLIYTAFKSENINIPRVSSAMAKSGNWIDLKQVKEGDLLFFATKKNNRKVNHVGLVTTSRTGNIEFIHATTSNGVIISNLAEKYWYFAFVQARRLL